MCPSVYSDMRTKSLPASFSFLLPGSESAAEELVVEESEIDLQEDDLCDLVQAKLHVLAEQEGQVYLAG